MSPDERAARRHAAEKIRLERKIEMAQLEAKLSAARRSKDVKRPPTDAERMDSEIQEYVHRIMGQHSAIARAKAQAAIDFKDDPDGLEKVILALEQWRESHA